MTHDPSQRRLDLLERENQGLQRAVEELSLLNRLAVEVGTLQSPDEIIATIVRTSLRAVGAEQGSITLIRPESDEPLLTLVRADSPSREHPAFHFTQALLGWMQIHQQPLLVNEPAGDERFAAVEWDPAVRSLLSAPLLVRSELRAVLTVFNKRGAQAFSDEDQRILAIIAAQSAQVLENARLAEEEKALLVMREQLRLASEIQTRLLPTRAPELPGYEIHAVTRPAQLVGGDYFDFIPLRRGRLAICLGDVSGKGVPASLLMANLQATLRGQVRADCAPHRCVGHANELLFESTGKAKFATLFYALLDIGKQQMISCNAGHNPPLHFPAGEESPRRLATGGPALGVLASASYRQQATAIAPGDLLVAFSDGVTEALGAREEEFGEHRLEDLVRSHRDLPPARLAKRILEALDRHGRGMDQHDDITLLMVRRQGEAGGRPG